VSNPNPTDLRAQLDAFVSYRLQYLIGDEKGEAQVFCDRLFKAFGHYGVREAGATLEMRVKKGANAKGTSFADLIWKPRCLIEMKKVGTDLSRHYRQAFTYWVNAVPDRPRYVILCNFDELWIYDFDQQMDAPVDRIALTDLPKRADALSFMLPEEVKPIFGNDLVAVTREAATKVTRVFKSIHERGVKRIIAQHFILQSVVAMFAEDVGLLPSKYFTRALDDSKTGSDAYDLLFGLFREMNTPGDTPGGRFKGTPYFNGGIFSEISAIELTGTELDALREATTSDWSAVRPEIFGTLFEGSMSEGERHAQGAHFTSQADIAKVVIPTIVNPWTKKINEAKSIKDIERLLGEMFSFRVLDPACGSGNFLYVAYREMRRLEHEAIVRLSQMRRSAALAAQSQLTFVTPDHFFGIDRNPFAVEVAKVTMMLAKKLAADELDEHENVLPLDNLDSAIVPGDALFMDWPAADVIVGNPPYMGRRKMQKELGADYTSRLAERYPGVGKVSNLVCYWFPLAHDRLPTGGRAGLVATQAIRDTSSREASLDYIVNHGGVIFDAVSREPWSGDAVVHVSIVNWAKGGDPQPRILWLNEGELRLEIPEIPSSLSPDVDVSSAVPLPSNREPKVCFQGQTPGVTKGFTLTAAEKDDLISKDPRSDSIIYPFLGGKELLHLLKPNRWVIDIGEDDAIKAETSAPAAFTHLRDTVLPVRQERADNEQSRNQEVTSRSGKAKINLHHSKFLARWWQLSYRRADMVSAISKLDRYIALTILASWERPSVYAFIDPGIRPSALLQVFAFDDDYSFGVLQSGIHRLWFEKRCSHMKVDPRYTPDTVFDSFPWPQAPSERQVEQVTASVADILQLRQRYLEEGLTLGMQYDTLRRPGNNKLRDAHARLDSAVKDAYGFKEDEDPLAQLLALNQDIAGDSAAARAPGAVGLEKTRVTNYKLSQ
jgi:N-6 DNA Methylase